jgi:hypothetical protein
MKSKWDTLEATVCSKGEVKKFLLIS